MDEQKIQILIDKIRGAKSIAIMGHKNPDGDSLCSVLALSRLSELNFGITPDCVYDGNLPDYLDDVPLRPHMRYYERVDTSAPYDLVFLLDYGIAQNIGGTRGIVDAAKFVIEIDHHINENPIGAGLCLNDTSAAATAQIVYDIMRAAAWKMDIDAANLMTIGIITDTGQFCFVNNGYVMRVVADLVDFGVSLRNVTSLISAKERDTILLETRVVSRAEFFHKNRLALATVLRGEYRHLDGKGATAMKLLGQIRGVEYVVLLKQQKENQTGVSIRSRMRPISHIAAALGGGGHPCAAGAVVNDTLENVRARVIELFEGE